MYGRRPESLYIRKIHCNTFIDTLILIYNTPVSGANEISFIIINHFLIPNSETLVVFLSKTCFKVKPRLPMRLRERNITVNHSTFRLCINKADQHLLLNSEVWPEDIVIKRYFFQECWTNSWCNRRSNSRYCSYRCSSNRPDRFHAYCG